MRYIFSSLLIIIAFLNTYGQQENNWKENSGTFMPEFMIGQTFESNDGFPDTSLQKQLVFSIGRKHDYNPQEWAYRLKRPKTGLSFSITDFGNIDSLGLGFTLLPYIEFNLLKKQKLTALVGIGGSYFSEEYDAVTNPQNQAVTTDFTWAFKLNFYYNVYQSRNIDWRVGVGYAHHSNGHSRLLNQGFNSALMSVSALIHNPKYEAPDNETMDNDFERSVYRYVSLRYGHGLNVLALSFNDKKNVYTIAGEYGWVYNNTFKFGIGFTYRFYEHYYDYVKDNESLVQDGREFERFKENPWRYATNFALTINGEILMNHIALEFQLGYNFHKPGYQIDWRINEGWDNTPRDIPEGWMLGEFNTKYELKKRIATQLGLKYYLFGTDAAPVHNVFLAAHITANLGQADFSELSLGYVYKLPTKGK